MKKIFSEKISKQLIDKIEKNDWYRHGIYRDNIFCSSIVADGLLAKFFAREGISRSFDYLKIDTEAYITQRDFDQISGLIFEKIRSNGRYLGKYVLNYREDNKKLIEFSKQINKADFHSANNEKLSFYLKRFSHLAIDLSHWLWSMEFLNRSIEDHLRFELQKEFPNRNKNKIEKILQKISYVPKKLPFQAEIDEIAKGVKYLSEERFARKLWRKYSWLKINTFDGRPFTFNEYLKRLEEMKVDARKRSIEREKGINAAERMIAKLKNKKIKRLIKMTQELIYLKTERIDVYSYAWFLVLDFIDEVCRRLGTSQEGFLALSYQEIIYYLEKNKSAPKREIEKRKKYVIWLDQGKILKFYEKAWQKIRKKIDGKKYHYFEEISGVSAQKGIARGEAKIVLTDRELIKIEKGDVLVANLTNPNYDTAFSKISAVITDEGGILCHSAIMAREFKIPCIIGTKIATQVLHDGDLVEVDANQGVVKILKRARNKK